MEELNTTKLSTLITTEPTEDQYAKYAAKVAEWTKEAYDNYAFKLYRPDARLSRDEDKYLYSMEVTILKNGHDEDWAELEKLYVMNNLEAERASMEIAKQISKLFDDEGIAVVSHSESRGNVTNLTGTGPYTITGNQPVESRIYFSKPEDVEKVKEAGLKHDTKVYYVGDPIE